MTSAYPEGPVWFMNNQTPLHAASGSSYDRALSALVNDVKLRYGLSSDAENPDLATMKHPTRKALRISKLDKQLSYIFNNSKDFKYIQKKYYEFMKSVRTHEKEKERGKDFNFDLIDVNGNSPLHLACRNGNTKIVNQLIFPEHQINCSIFLDNFDNWAPVELRHHAKVKEALENFVRLTFQSKEITPKQLKPFLKYRYDSPVTPLIALKIRAKDTQIVNKLINVLKTSKFIVNMFGAIENQDEIFYVLLNMSRENLEKNAAICDSNLIDFDIRYRASQESFRNKDKQLIMHTVLNRLLNIP